MNNDSGVVTLMFGETFNAIALEYGGVAGAHRVPDRTSGSMPCSTFCRGYRRWLLSSSELLESAFSGDYIKDVDLPSGPFASPSTPSH